MGQVLPLPSVRRPLQTGHICFIDISLCYRDSGQSASYTLQTIAYPDCYPSLGSCARNVLHSGCPDNGAYTFPIREYFIKKCPLPVGCIYFSTLEAHTAYPLWYSAVWEYRSRDTLWEAEPHLIWWVWTIEQSAELRQQARDGSLGKTSTLPTIASVARERLVAELRSWLNIVPSVHRTSAPASPFFITASARTVEINGRRRYLPIMVFATSTGCDLVPAASRIRKTNNRYTICEPFWDLLRLRRAIPCHYQLSLATFSTPTTAECSPGGIRGYRCPGIVECLAEAGPDSGNWYQTKTCGAAPHKPQCNI